MLDFIMFLSNVVNTPMLDIMQSSIMFNKRFERNKDNGVISSLLTKQV